MSIVRQRYEGAGTTPTIVPTDPLPGTANYFLGSDTTKWRTNLATYTGIVYQQLYPGIDLSYDGTNGQLKSTYTVAVGADPSRIRWHYQGVQDVQVDAATGDLLIILAPPRRISATQTYTITEQAPVAWQTINGQRVSVTVQFVVGAGGRVSFSLGAYDTHQPLTIDPTLTYSTYLGGVYGDYEYGLALDSAGNIYVTGASSSTNFPTTAGALDTTYDPNGDLYVAKLTADGSAWAYSTFVGGSNYDIGIAIAVDSAGNAFVTGETQSTNFPTTVGAYDRTCGTDGSCNPDSNNNLRQDDFIIKLNSTGSALSYGTYLGGGDRDAGAGIALDTSGNAYVTGQTTSTNFPTTSGAYDTTCGTDSLCNLNAANFLSSDIFVVKVNASGSSLSYSTYLGGSDMDAASAIALDSANNAYLAGRTSSSTYPTTSGVAQTTFGGNSDVVVTKLNATGTALGYSTFLGGNGDDWGNGIALDTSNNAYVTGSTESTTFPTTVGAYDRTCGTDTTCNNNSGSVYKDAFITKVNTAGTAWTYSTYLGGSDFETGRAIAVDTRGNAYITGQTQSTNYPVTLDAWQPTNYGHFDVIVSEINPSGSALIYSTYLGGSSEPWLNSEQTEDGRGIAVDSSGTIYVAGITNSTDFPRASGAPQQTYGGGS